MARQCARIADEKRAEDIQIYDLNGMTDFADYFVVASGDNRRQLQAISREIETQMRLAKVSHLGTEGFDDAQWILVDYGSVIMHLFLPDIRKRFDFDLLWGDAPRAKW
jgi:ribosome-associated protein